MPLTVQQVGEHVQHALYVTELPPVLSLLPLVNQAGNHLCEMHEWSWLIRPPQDLGTTVSQTYVNLPSDFREVIALDFGAASSGGEVHWGSLQDVSEWRRLGIGSSANVLVSLSYAATMQPRLELGHTPSATSATFFKLSYRAGWAQVTSDTAFITVAPGGTGQVPLWCEALYLLIVREIARGWVHDMGPAPERLGGVREHPFFHEAVKTDSRQVPVLGEMWRGDGHRNYGPSFFTGLVPDP